MIVKPSLVINDEEMGGGKGSTLRVVTGRVFDTVLPPLLLAVTITL